MGDPALRGERFAAVTLRARVERAGRALQRLDVRSLQALLALLHFEFNALVLGQALEARGTLDFAEVGEQVLAAGVRGDEPEALAVIEPLHDTGFGRHIFHSLGLQKIMRGTCPHK